jgi:hypothetical protein
MGNGKYAEILVLISIWDKKCRIFEFFREGPLKK